MAEPYKKEFKITLGGEDLLITSVVIDEDDFMTLCESQQMANISSKHNLDIAVVKSSKHIPLIRRGSMTQFIFDDFQIDTDYACVCVRGLTERMMRQKS
jgi:hypothetical protein